MKPTITILLICIIYFSCKHEPIIMDDHAGQISPFDSSYFDNQDTILFGGDPCDPDTIYFENFIQPLLMSSCAQTGCHSAESAEDGVVLDNYFNIIVTGDVDPYDPNDSEIYEVITDNDLDDRMPPEGEDPLTPEQIQMIFNWIAQGAQNNACSSCDTSNATYSQAIYPLVEIKCQGCHSGTNPSGGVYLNDYIDISEIANTGAFYSAITGSNGFTPMPYNANPLPQCEIDIITAWIEDGAPNN